jgi:hypothetical protein
MKRCLGFILGLAGWHNPFLFRAGPHGMSLTGLGPARPLAYNTYIICVSSLQPKASKRRRRKNNSRTVSLLNEK